MLAFGMLVGWLAQVFLGLGTRPNGQSFVGAVIVLAVWNLAFHPTRQ
jgi:uncharacterized membrane protein YeaQ/YmgE (transglycosylase-associated protein family)